MMHILVQISLVKTMAILHSKRLNFTTVVSNRRYIFTIRIIAVSSQRRKTNKKIVFLNFWTKIGFGYILNNVGVRVILILDFSELFCPPDFSGLFRPPVFSELFCLLKKSKTRRKQNSVRNSKIKSLYVVIHLKPWMMKHQKFLLKMTKKRNNLK